MSNPIIKGDSSVHDHFTGGRRESAGVEETVTFVRQGLYADLKAGMPLRGEKYNGFPVISSELTPARGGMGLLTIKCTSGRVREVQYEVDSSQVERPLLSHRKFKNVAAEVDAWRNAPENLRAEYRYQNAAGDVVLLSATGIAAAKLIQAGIESYLAFAPVARKITTKTGVKPHEAWHDVGSDCGKRNSPPGVLNSLVGGSWKWLKTGDRATASSGSCVRTEEWTGAEDWSKVLYEA